jgi:hypothetical protein
VESFKKEIAAKNQQIKLLNDENEQLKKKNALLKAPSKLPMAKKLFPLQTTSNAMQQRKKRVIRNVIQR